MHSTGLPVAAYLDAHAVVIHVIPPALRGKKVPPFIIVCVSVRGVTTPTPGFKLLV